jgi:hypothetical protein
MNKFKEKNKSIDNFIKKLKKKIILKKEVYQKKK